MSDDDSEARIGDPPHAAPSRRARRLRRWAIGAAIALGLYALAGFLLAPYLVQHYVPRFATERLERQAEIGEVRVNPFLLTFEARDFALREADDRPLLALGRLFVDLELKGLFHWAWTFAEIRIETPDLNLVLGPDARLNLARLGDAFPPDPNAPPPEEDAAPPRLVLEKLVLQDGALAFTDQTLAEPATAEARSLNLELTDISTLPERRGPYGLRAQLPSGGEITWQGELALNPVTSTGALQVRDLKVGGIWPLLHAPLRVAGPAGDLDLDLTYRLAYTDGALSFAAEPIGLSLRGFALTGPGAEPALTLEHLELAGARFDLASREFVVPALTLRGGHASAARDADGALDWTSLLIRPPADGASPEEASPTVAEQDAGAPWTVRLDALAIEELGLAFHDAYRATPVDFAIGEARLGLRAVARLGGAQPELTAEAVEIALSGIEGREVDGTTLLALDSVRLDEGRVDLATRAVTVPRLAVQGGRIAAAVDADGTLNWTAPPAGARAETAPEETAEDVVEPVAPWSVDLASLTLDGVGIDFSDASRVTPIALAVGSTRVELQARAEVGGGSPQVVAEELGIALREVALKDGDGKPVLEIDAVAVDNGRLDLAARRLDVAGIRVDRGKTQLNRETDGTVRELALFTLSDRGKLRRELQTIQTEATSEGKPWQIAIDTVALDDSAVAYTDATSDPAVAFDFDAIDLTLSDVSNDGATPIRYDGRLRVRQGGGARVTGQVSQSGDRASADIALEGLALAPLAPLLSRIAALDLDGGTLSSQIELAYAASGEGPKLEASGGVSLRDLLIREKISGDRFLAWDALDANGVSLRLEPDALVIDEVRLAGPGAKIVVFEDRTVNLARVFDQSPDAGQSPPADTPPTDDADSFPVSVKRIRVDDGEVDFADLSLVLPFATRIEGLGGDVTGLAPGPEARATLALEGQVGEFGQATVDGSLAPFAPKAFADVTVAFRNVAMSPLSAYTATFAGRKIASGKLDLDLEYKLDQSELLGENRVVLREFTLGERVESPDAADLPLDLAVALLSDASGKIEARLPVRGNVDNPEFSYGGLVGQAIANLIGRIVTAPFRALGAALGQQDGDYDTVFFAAGHSTLAPPEREKLARVASALAARPQLALKVDAAYAPDADGHALRRRDVALALAAELDEAVAAGDEPPPPDFAGADTQLALEKLAEDQIGETVLDAFAARLAAQEGREIARVNPIAGRLGRASPDAAFYAALFGHLVESAPLEPSRLDALGQARATAIVDELASKPGVAAARLTQAEPAETEAADGGVPVALELGVHGGG